jgi:hypothetical protein
MIRQPSPYQPLLILPDSETDDDLIPPFTFDIINYILGEFKEMRIDLGHNRMAA